MEKKYCPNCFSKLEENVATCPFCGVKPAEIDEGVSSLLLKANAIWGNQAVYADKIKGISAKVAMQLLRWYVDSEKYSEMNTEASIAPSSIRNAFDQMLYQNSAADFEFCYQELMGYLSDISSNKRTVRATGKENVATVLEVIEQLKQFELSLQLQSKIDYTTLFSIYDPLNQDKGNAALVSGLSEYAQLGEVIKESYKVLQNIINVHSFLCVSNCTYEKEQLKMLTDIMGITQDGKKVYRLQPVIEALKQANRSDYSDLFDEKAHEEFILLFLESLWVYMEAGIIMYSESAYAPDESVMKRFLTEWSDYMGIVIDRCRCVSNVDMTSVYLRAKTALAKITEMARV